MPENVIRLREIIRSCTLCPRCCQVDRTLGELGSCRIAAEAVLASAGAHFGEEPVLVGSGGSGTIFFCGCNLHCVFCQNSDISQSVDGQAVSPEQIASLALQLERSGCENVNFVTPTPVAHVAAEAIVLARRAGLTVPIVYNCGGYESLETLRLLNGLVEIYMPDFKYARDEAGSKYSGVENYPSVASAALAEMFRQVGPLETDARGVATHGLLVRHLVLPGDLAGSREVIDLVAACAPGCAINVMGQYRPAYRARQFPELRSRPAAGEVRSLREYAEKRGLARVDH